MRFPLSPKASFVAALLLLTAMRGTSHAQDVDQAHDGNVAGQAPAGSAAAAVPPGWRLDLHSSAPLPQIHFPAERQTAVHASILPSAPNFARFGQTAPAPRLNTSNPFDVQTGQRADALNPKTPRTPPLRNPAQQDLCSVPLLRVQPSPSTYFTIGQAPAPPVDRAMVVEPSAPSCDETTSAQKPGMTLPLPPKWSDH
ncbi:MAG: hypothetical protein ACLQVL_29605 [Terriglobia bacterium]